MKYKIETYLGAEEITLYKSSYANNRLAIQAYCKDGPYATLTVNLPEVSRLPEGHAFVDTNNCPWAEKFLEENGIAEFTGIMGRSGFCAYPLYKFNLDKL